MSKTAMTPRTIRAKLTGQVLTLDTALQEVLPALLALLDALPEGQPVPHPSIHRSGSSARSRPSSACSCVRAQEQPLLLVFEDSHSIDSETQALLNSLVEGLPTTRLLLLVNYRPEYQHGWGSKTYYTQLRLDPLEPAQRRGSLAKHCSETTPA